MTSPFALWEDPLQRRANYYTSENKIDSTLYVLRALSLPNEGGQKCRVIVSHFHTHYVIMPNDYNNLANTLILGTRSARNALIFRNEKSCIAVNAAHQHIFTCYKSTCNLLFLQNHMEIADPFLFPILSSPITL